MLIASTSLGLSIEVVKKILYKFPFQVFSYIYFGILIVMPDGMD